MKIVLLSCLLFLSSCSFFKSEKPKVFTADAIAKLAGVGSKKVLGCSTGSAVEADLKVKLYEWFRVQESSNESKGLIGSLCSVGVRAVLPYFVDLGTGFLPASWKADNCSLQFAGDSLENLALKLCGDVAN